MDIETIVFDYMNGKSVISIAKENDCSEKTIYKILKRNGIDTSIKSKISKDDVPRLIQSYLSGKSGKQVGIEFGVTDRCVFDILEKNGIPRRVFSCHSRKFHVNDDFFDTINTEAKAYFFGLLFADGSVNERLTNVNITLQEGDKDILEALSKYIQPDKRIYFQDLSNRKDGVTRKNSCRVEISSIPMCKKLNSYGLVPRKSLIKTFPEVILNSTENIQRHFIRGYFDGNGSLTCHISMNDYLDGSVIAIASTYEMCLTMNSIFHVFLSLETKVNKLNNFVNSFVVYNCKIHQCEIILDWLYKDSMIHLKRKYEKYLLFKEKMRNRNENRY